MANVAAIHSLATEASVHAESAAWARFSASRDQTEFRASWLAILCSQIDRVNGGLLILGPDAEGAFVPTALWPDASRDLRHLGPTAERALAERRGVVAGAGGDPASTRDAGAYIGYPIEVSGVLHGAVVLDIGPGPDAALQRALRLLHWSSAWLVDRFRQQAQEEAAARLARLTLAMDIVASAVQERRLGPSALAVVNDLAGRLKCDRVSIGLEQGGDVVVETISHTATFDAKMSLVRLIGEAMDEVLDLDATLVYPPRDGDELAAIAHAELAAELKDIAICSVPLMEAGHGFGAIVFERAAGEVFDPETIELCKTVGELLGPILALKRDNERSLPRRMRDSGRDTLQMLFGPSHPGIKLIALVVVAVVVFFSIADAAYRVSAKTAVEGAVQRAAVAPFDGHIVFSAVRAGDIVKAGAVLCRLDDRDLKLEHARLQSEREQARRKYRQALATQERGTMMVLAAQIAQNDAQISLVADKLSRATLIAPFDGVVVSGDLSQLLGTPVEQGKLLFQIAPLDAYRVILEVDERDIAAVEIGQTGELILAGLAHRKMDFSVRQITPVSSQQEGRNYFRVEAELRSPPDRIRPGMEGVGKISIGDRKLIWIWTHSFVDWLRAWAWKELP